MSGDPEQAAAESAGVAAASVVATAAALVAMVARVSHEWADADAARGQAEALRHRAEMLRAENATSYAAALRALEQPGAVDLGAALERAAEVPLRIAETANDVTLLAKRAAERCDPRVSADALAAASLAAGAAAAAAELVAANLTALEGDARVQRAHSLALSARRVAGTIAR